MEHPLDAFRLDGINLEEISGGENLIISPHPVAIPIALILHQIGMLTAVELCTATVVQPSIETNIASALT